MGENITPCILPLLIQLNIFTVKLHTQQEKYKKITSMPEHKTQNTKHKTQNTKHKTQNTKHKTVFISIWFWQNKADG